MSLPDILFSAYLYLFDHRFFFPSNIFLNYRVLVTSFNLLDSVIILSISQSGLIRTTIHTLHNGVDPITQIFSFRWKRTKKLRHIKAIKVLLLLVIWLKQPSNTRSFLTMFGKKSCRMVIFFDAWAAFQELNSWIFTRRAVVSAFHAWGWPTNGSYGNISQRCNCIWWKGRIRYFVDVVNSNLLQVSPSWKHTRHTHAVLVISGTTLRATRGGP